MENQRLWDATKRIQHAKMMNETVKVGDKVRIVWLDGGYGGLKSGMIATVADKSSTEIRVYIPETKYSRINDETASLYWYEVELLGFRSPLERKLREFSAG